MTRITKCIRARLWTWSYALAEQRYEAHLQHYLWRQATCCIGLIVLRRLGF